MMAQMRNGSKRQTLTSQPHTMTPRTQKALLLKTAKSSFALETTNTPTPGPGEILVKVQATSLNPIDWKIQKYSLIVKDYPAVLGVDAAGDVEELGEGVTGVSVGDRVLVHLCRLLTSRSVPLIVRPI